MEENKSTIVPEKSQEMEIDLIKLDFRIFLITLQRRIIYIIIAAVIGFIIAAIAAKTLIKNKWYAQCILFRHNEQAFSQKDLPQVNKPLDINTVIETIRTRRNIEQVIKKLKLKISAPDLFSKTEVIKHKNNNIIKITAIDNDRKTAADIANTLAQVFIREYINILNSTARKVYSYYSLNRQEIVGRIEKYNKELEAFKKTHKIISMESQSASKFEQLKGAEVKVMENRMLEEALKIKIADISSNVSKMKPEIQLSYTVSAGEKKALQDLEAELLQMKQKFTDENPKVMRLKAKIEALRKTVSNSQPVPEKITYGGNELRRTMEQEKLEAESKLKSVRKNIQDLKTEIKSIRSELANLSRLDIDYMELKRKLEINRDLLKNVESIIAASKVAIKANISDIEILEKAVPPRYPAASRRKIIAAAGGIFFGGTALVIFMLIEFLSFSVKSKYDFDKLLKIKYAGSLPVKDVVPEYRFFSAVQMIYDRINDSAGNKKPLIMAVGSDEPESGKTFIINSLIPLYHYDNLKVMYIDTVQNPSSDIEKCIINQALYSQDNGRAFDTNAINDKLDKAYFNFNADTYRYPLKEEQFNKFIAGLEHYDLIIFELFEPSGNLQLFARFAAVSDVTLLIGQFRHSNKFRMKRTCNFLKDKNIDNLVGILNSVEKKYYEGPV